MKKMFFIVFSFLCISLFSTNFSLRAENTAFERHVAGFEKVIQGAEKDPYYKYGIYSSRIIAVKHPEVYLQGDMIFAEFVTSHAGYEKAYSEKPDSLFLNNFNKLNKLRMEPFNFDTVDFQKYDIVSKETIYGEEMPVLGFLDERLSPVQLNLKVKQITSLEGADLFYIKRRLQGKPVDNIFIIFTKDKFGFVYDESKFYDCLGREIKAEAIKDPVLIFNEKSVWYPLMERDDTQQDANLKRLVKALTTSNNIPSLDDTEKKLLSGLKYASDLTPGQVDYASIASINFISGRTLTSKVHPRISGAFPDIFDRRALMFIVLPAMKNGDYLSPYAAYLARMVSSNTTESLKQFETFYLERVGTTKEWIKGRNHYSAWGHSWPCGLIENNLEDAFRTRGGHCVSQTTNISAALELGGIRHSHFTYRSASAEKSHTIVWMPEYKKTFDNGWLVMQDGYKGYFETAAMLPEIIEMMIGDQIIVFSDDFIYSNVSKEEACQMHRKADQLGKEIFDTGTVLPFKENAEAIEMMQYKTYALP